MSFFKTGDLAKNKLPTVSKFRDFLYGDLLKLIQKITNIELSATKIDVTSSKYEHTGMYRLIKTFAYYRFILMNSMITIEKRLFALPRR